MNQGILWLIVELAANLFEAIILFSVLDTFFERKIAKPRLYILFPVIHMVVITAMNTLDLGMLPSSLLLLLICWLYVHFLYITTWRNSILSIILYYVVWFLTELSVVLILGLIFTISMDDLFEQSLYRLIGIALSKTIQFIILKIIQHLRLKSRHGFETRTWFSLMIFPLATMFTSFAWYSLGRSIRSDATVVSFTVSSLVMLFANLVIFYLFESNVRQMNEQHTLEMVQMHTENEIERLNQLKDNHNRLRQVAHDLQNKLVPLNVLIQDDRKKEALDYIQKIQGNISQFKGTLESGNPVVDMILNQKNQTAEEKGIKIHFRLDDCSAIKIPSDDICVILGNALDNAIEACQKFSDPEDRQIKCEFVHHHQTCMVKITNPVIGPLMQEDGNYMTTKQDNLLHGIGLKSIRQIVERNQGFLSLNNEGQTFEFCVILPV